MRVAHPRQQVARSDRSCSSSLPSRYQLALVTPGSWPSSASLRKQIRHSRNLRRNRARRPQRPQRLCAPHRELRLAPRLRHPCLRRHNRLPLPHLRNGMPRPPQQGLGLVVRPGRGHDAHVHALHLLHLGRSSPRGRRADRAARACSCRVRRTRAATRRGSRGRAAAPGSVSRSRNSHMRDPRSVTRQPIGIPARSLKFAIDLRARVTAGRCPAIVRQLLDRLIEQLGIGQRVADTHVDHDLRQARHGHRRAVAELAAAAPAPPRPCTAAPVWACSSLLRPGLLVELRAATSRHAHPPPVLQRLPADAGRSLRFGVDEHRRSRRGSAPRAPRSRP